MLSSSQIRESFLKFFETKKHLRIKSASLIPQNDPTLFFTNAGMVPFKNVFTGQEKLNTKRATSSQKCMRVSGKHNDLENVGRTHRHHTFFEMLGNFSFGDYFKKEAIEFAWEYLTEVLKLDKNRLWVTVFREDDEAEELWKKHTDVAPERIVRMDEADNFWSMGETGPCGPSTEIHFDHGEKYSCGKPDCKLGCDCDRYMEIWNLVFMQFDRQKDGTLNPLPKPSVDTGMGLERLSCVVQGVHSNYDSDLFTPLLDAIGNTAQKKYGENENTSISMRVIADHIRASVFLIGDGVLPSNEGRGYVLRRIMRRAIRHGRLLGLHEPFFYKIAPVVIEEMKDVYVELKTQQRFIEEVILAEEQRFLETLEKGLDLLNDEIERTKKQNKNILSGAIAFKLYDTFGFPLDLSETIAAEAQLRIDHEEFQKQMAEQKQKARSAWKGSGQEKKLEVHQELAAEGIRSDFLGYQSLHCLSQISALIKNGQRVEKIEAGDEAEIYTEHSPFYAESGGQVGDQGKIFGPDLSVQIKDTKTPLPGLIAHFGKVEKGTLKVGDEVELEVHSRTRNPTRLNHTATHLLHAALRQIVGEHVKQAGSLVNAERLRFDFSHFKALSADEIKRVEDLVNEKIREDIEVQKNHMSYDDAIQSGAMALFGEKYGDEVRVLKVGDFSTELCGGTHVDRTGEIGSFKITSESSVAAGVRRIEAITGASTIEYLRQLESRWQTLAQKLKVSPEEVGDRVEKISEQLKKSEKEVQKLKMHAASGGNSSNAGGSSIEDQIENINGIKLLTLRRDIDDLNALRTLSDQLLQKLQSGVLALASVHEGKVTLIVKVSKDLSSKYHAGNLIKEIAKLIEGSGGGRPDMAQAGGTRPEGLDQAFAKIKELI